MLQIIPIPALSDNYIWVIHENNEAIIVDPAEAGKVLDFLVKNQLKPTAILLTHNHADHTDGVEEIIATYPTLAVYGPVEVAQFASRLVQPDDRFSLLGHQFQVILSAGHTAQHISYLMDWEHLFCGDSLFSGGCGRVFTGDYQAQFETLQRFNGLPDTVKIYAGHEYTVSNLKFAEAVLPPGCELFEQSELAQIKRMQNRPTLPSTIGIERKINPFLRAQSVEEFTVLRKQKDTF